MLIGILVIASAIVLALLASGASPSVPSSAAPTPAEVNAKRLQLERLERIQAETKRKADALFPSSQAEAKHGTLDIGERKGAK